MKKARQILSGMIRSPQYKKSIMLMELFSQYRSAVGHDLPTPQVLCACHLTVTEYDNILAGSTDEPLYLFDDIAKDIKEQYQKQTGRPLKLD